jgi:uncharacterized repeat protein (TIGR02543 family)
VILNENYGETPVTGEIIVVYGGIYSSLTTPTRDGWTFTGWYTAASGGTKVESGDTVGELPENYTLYAHWEIICNE